MVSFVPVSTPPTKKEMVERGYMRWKGQWIHKKKHKAQARQAFYDALRRAVKGR